VGCIYYIGVTVKGEAPFIWPGFANLSSGQAREIGESTAW